MEDRIKRVIAEVFSVPVMSITNESSPYTISKWDSLGHMNLCTALEEEFHVEFDDRQVTAMLTYDVIVRTLTQCHAR